MKYPLLDPPIRSKFRDMSAAELSSYKAWFCAHLSEVDSLLEIAVRDTAGFERWRPTLDRKSLEVLGEWVGLRIKEQTSENAEFSMAQFHLQDRVIAALDPLTPESFSLSADAGLYLAKALSEHCHKLSWKQEMRRKDDIDYGKMVLCGFEKQLIFEPIRMGVVLAYGIQQGKKSGSGLSALFDYWSMRALKNYH